MQVRPDRAPEAALLLPIRIKPRISLIRTHLSSVVPSIRILNSTIALFVVSTVPRGVKVKLVPLELKLLYVSLPPTAGITKTELGAQVVGEKLAGHGRESARGARQRHATPGSAGPAGPVLLGRRIIKSLDHAPVLAYLPICIPPYLRFASPIVSDLHPALSPAFSSELRKGLVISSLVGSQPLDIERRSAA